MLSSVRTTVTSDADADGVLPRSMQKRGTSFDRAAPELAS